MYIRIDGDEQALGFYLRNMALQRPPPPHSARCCRRRLLPLYTSTGPRSMRQGGVTRMFSIRDTTGVTFMIRQA